MIFWLLAREVRILRGELGKSEDWDVMVDLFFYKELDKPIEAEEGDDKAEEEDKAITKPEKAWDGQGENAEEEGNWEWVWHQYSVVYVIVCPMKIALPLGDYGIYPEKFSLG